LEGVRYEDQHGLWNYCAPANLSMALSFWKWKGDRVDVGTYVKPYGKDKNVMPSELADFVVEKTDLNVVLRVGGDDITLKRFLVAGFPVLIERGAFLAYNGVTSWMGHFQVVTGYDEAGGYFIVQDTYLKPNLEVPIDELVSYWRQFNYTYLVIYPHGKYNEVMNILGPDADVNQNYQNAATKASNETVILQGEDKYFAWFNRGDNLASLQDYGGASTAFDEAFTLYPSIPEDRRPWRIIWYRTGPYKAYFGAQRYWDVINLATTTLDTMVEPILEESYYWRARAEWELGDNGNAINDFKESLKYHPGFGPTLYQAQLLGINP
jgi:tetratricopeptide (TPR) repeat protein